MAAPLCSQLFSPLPALFYFLSPSQFPGESPVRASLSFAERAHLSVFVRLVHAGSRRKHEEIARGGGEFRLLVEFNCLFRAPSSRHRDGRRSSPFFSSPRSSLYFPLLALCASANQQRASAPRDSRAQKGRRQEERRALRRKKKTMHRASFFFPQGFFFFPVQSLLGGAAEHSISRVAFLLFPSLERLRSSRKRSNRTRTCETRARRIRIRSGTRVSTSERLKETITRFRSSAIWCLFPPSFAPRPFALLQIRAWEWIFDTLISRLLVLEECLRSRGCRIGAPRIVLEARDVQSLSLSLFQIFFDADVPCLFDPALQRHGSSTSLAFSLSQRG